MTQIHSIFNSRLVFQCSDAHMGQQMWCKVHTFGPSSDPFMDNYKSSMACCNIWNVLKLTITTPLHKPDTVTSKHTCKHRLFQGNVWNTEKTFDLRKPEGRNNKSGNKNEHRDGKERSWLSRGLAWGGMNNRKTDDNMRLLRRIWKDDIMISDEVQQDALVSCFQGLFFLLGGATVAKV